MAKTPNQLTTAADILAVYNSLAEDTVISSEADSNELMQDLTRLFVSKPIKEILGCARMNGFLFNDVFEKMYRLTPDDLEIRKAVVATGLSLVDCFIQSGETKRADNWLERCYGMCPRGSVEEKIVVTKGISLVDEFVRDGEIVRAHGWLSKGFRLYPRGSKERSELKKKFAKVVKESAAVKFGSRKIVDVAGLRKIVQRELKKIRQPVLGATVAAK